MAKGVMDVASNRRNYINKRRMNRPIEKIKSKQVGQNVRQKLGEFDFTFLFLVFVLLAFGLVMLLSASTPAANTKFGDSYHFFLRQLLGVVIGAVGMAFTAMIDYNKYKKLVPMAMLVCIIMLVCVRIPGIGVYRSGAWRWLKTPIMEIQPSEFMKPVIALFFAKMISERKYRVDILFGMLPYLGVLLVVGLLMLIEPHLSGAIVICGIGVVVMVVGGAKIRYFVAAILCVSPVGFVLLKQDPVRWGRVLSFIDPFRDVSGTSYQISQSLIALGSGGFFGKGLGQSVQKYTFLPEPYNDFIFAVVCEELGLMGAMIIMMLFVALVMRGLKIAFEAPDTYGMLAVVGIISHIAIQTAFNIAVVCSAIPTTGISLPFFSYGGTAIMVLLTELGIVLNVSRQSIKINSIPK